MQVSEEQEVKVLAKELYSCNPSIIVEEGQVFELTVNPEQTWKDWCIKTPPDGFFNPFLMFFKKRVKKAKCFCLCGTIDKDELNHFQIGSGVFSFTAFKGGNLYFFPNDNVGHYKNNNGSIVLTIKRIS